MLRHCGSPIVFLICSFFHDMYQDVYATATSQLLCTTKKEREPPLVVLVFGLSCCRVPGMTIAIP